MGGDVVRFIICLIVGASVAACSVPPYDLTVNGPPTAPAGPKIAALLANLKCELYVAANDQHVIPRYYDDPSIKVHYDDPTIPGHSRDPNPDRWFTLRNLFQEIEFVGEAQFQLDVTSTPSGAISTNFINPYTASSNLTLAVAGSLSDAAHRNLGIYSSIDFERLVESPPYPGVKNTEGPVATFLPGEKDPSEPCGGHTELGGFLGLQEDLTYHAITGDMNDLSVWPAKNSTVKISSTDFFSKWGVDAIQITIDFTITSGINGGPTWTLTRFKGPTGGSPFIGYTRAVKDTLTLTIIPICIRQMYRAANKTAPYHYIPELIEGTPRWGDFLPPCAQSQSQLKPLAVSTARTYNIIKTNGSGSSTGAITP
jgi:hypothetical protein